MQNFGGKHRHQNRVRHAHETDDREQQQHGADGRKCGNISPAFLELNQHTRGRFARRPALDLHGQQRSDDGKIAHAVNQETITFPTAAMMIPASAGPNRRAPLTMVELSAMALLKSVRPSTI
jgi:hypothetical protein